MRTCLAVLVTCTAVGLIGPTTGAAQEPMGRGACRADVEKLCKGVEPGQGRILQCLQNNEAQVSAACKEQLTQMREHMRGRMEEFSQACQSDVQRYCTGMTPGQRRIADCLKENEANLSQACRDELAQARDRREHMRQRMREFEQACRGDAEQYCADVQPGGGRLLRCLKQNEAKLSAGCKAAMQPPQ